MHSLKKTFFQLIIFVFFAIISVISINFATGLMYCAIFIPNIFKKTSNYTIFFISLFLDIYSFAFIGITFASAIIFYLLSSKIKFALQSFIIKFGYFLLFLCFCKIIIFLFISLLGYQFDISSHISQISFALLSYTIYHFYELLDK
jgi:hypothetical protein